MEPFVISLLEEGISEWLFLNPSPAMRAALWSGGGEDFSELKGEEHTGAGLTRFDKRLV